MQYFPTHKSNVTVIDFLGKIEENWRKFVNFERVFAEVGGGGPTRCEEISFESQKPLFRAKSNFSANPPWENFHIELSTIESQYSKFCYDFSEFVTRYVQNLNVLITFRQLKITKIKIFRTPPVSFSRSPCEHGHVTTSNELSLGENFPFRSIMRSAMSTKWKFR